MSLTAFPCTALILAAGLGARLSGAGGDRPKGMLEVGGEALVPRALRLLKEIGVTKFMIVIGWRGEIYRTALEEWGQSLQFVENPVPESTGSLHSLALGAEAVGGDFWLLESDILFEPRALSVLRDQPAEDALLTSDFTQSRDEVWVYADGAGRLEHLTKRRRAGAAPVGELVGIMRVSAGLSARLQDAATALPATAHYEDGLNAVCGVHPVTLISGGDLAWGEIDDAGQLRRARERVWPQIAAREGVAREAHAERGSETGAGGRGHAFVAGIRRRSDHARIADDAV